MKTARGIWPAALAALVVFLPAVPGWAAAQESKYSGTVVAVDQGAGTIVVEGMGPWRVKDGATRVDRRTIAVTPSTEIVRLKRVSGAAPSGWAGDFVESALPGRQLKPGDWVTVTVKPDGKRATATRIDVSDPSEP